jgi:hypothetical protein
MYIKPAEDTGSVTIDFSANVLLTNDMLAEKIKSLDNLSDQDIYILVRDYYDTILTDIFESKDNNKKSDFIDLFMQPKFIIALTQVMYNIPPENITSQTKRRLNKMSFDYLMIDENDRDKYISGLLMALSKTVNRDKIPRLCTIPLPEDMASLLALARYSSEKEVLNVKRLNKVLMSQPLTSLSEQKIVDIYLALFEHVLPLFTGVLLDVVSPQNMNSNSSEIYGLITLAMLDIMNELPIADIKTGLVRFEETRQIWYPDSPLRLNLESCSEEDYPRVLCAIDQLKTEGVYITTK